MGFRTLLCAAVSAAALSPAVFASDAADGAEAAPEDVIYVYGTRSSYAEDESSSATRTPTPLEDLPQSLFVITRDVIDDQAMTGLGELVRYVPGVTMGQGEGHRDAPIFRGNITTSDFFVDGLRDDLQYLRDLYNVERVDVIKGPSALVFGRGTGGGAINRVSKAAGADVRAIDLSLGTFGQARAALDLGAEITPAMAARVNAVIEDSESFRNLVEIERRGLAPAAAFDLGPDTRLDVFGEWFEDQRTVDRGVPSENGRPWSGPEDVYFGNPDLSYSEIEVGTLRAVLSHDLGNGFNVRGALSYGDYSKFYRNVYPGGPVSAGQVRISSYDSATDRENLLAQADLIWEGAFGGFDHTLLVGVEAGRQESENVRVNAQSALFDITDRGRNFTPDFTVPAARDNVNELGLFAVLVQDQVDLTDDLKAVLGLRWDRFDLDFIDRRPGAQNFSRTDEFVSPKLGLVWEPSDGLSLYAGWSQSYLPQSGDQFSSLSVTTAALDPEEFENTEIGLRWQPAPELLVSAALYRLDRTNTTAPGATPGTVVLTGSQRSEGLELSVQGEVREGWNVIGALAVQDSEITSTTDAAPAGRSAPLVPDFSASLWNRVALTDRFDVALGLVHQSEQYASITNAVELPAYTRIDAAAFYALTDRIDLQLNVENLAGETYWFSAHNDNNISPGAPANARLTLSARF
ncbi:MAG: TonB-dependent siderophore receptor [Oceanicaulis sp.]